jgi:hypothetical protein
MKIISHKIIVTFFILLFFSGGLLGISSFAEETAENTPRINTSSEAIHSAPDEIASTVAEAESSTSVSPDVSTNTSTSPTPSSTPDNTSDNAAIQILRDRQTKIQETLEDTPEEKKIEEEKEALEIVEAEKSALEGVNEEISLSVEELQKQLNAAKEKEKKLLEEQEDSEKKQEELRELKKSTESLEYEISQKNLLLEKNKQDLEILSLKVENQKIFYNQLIEVQAQLNAIKEEESHEKYVIFFIITGLFLLLYIVRIWLSRKIKQSRDLKKKYAHRLTAFDVFSVVFYIGFLIWFFFYIKPELVVYLLFLVGAIAIILQEYLFSMISSIFIVQMYSVGDRILFQGKEGLIEKMTLLKISLRTIDERGTDMSEVRVIPNSQFMKNEVIQLPKKSIEKANFRLILPNDLSINQPVLTRYIEEEVLKKNITIKSFNEITEKEYFYDIDFSFANTGQPIIDMSWYETREKSIRIKRKILEKLDEMKKSNASKGCKDESHNMGLTNSGRNDDE